MSDRQSSCSKQKAKHGKKTVDDGGGSRGGGRVKDCLHAVTDEQAALLKETREKCLLQDIKKETGADVKFYPHPSPVPGMKIVIISGVPSQIKAAVTLIPQMTGARATLSEEAQTFWLQWVEAAYPDLDSRIYFLPPVYFNRVPMTRVWVAGQQVLVPQTAPREGSKQKLPVTKCEPSCEPSAKHEPPNQDGLHLNQTVSSQLGTTEASTSQHASVQDSDIREDVAMKQVLSCLRNMLEKTREVLVGITRFHFAEYLSEPGFKLAAAQLPRFSNLPPKFPKNWKQGDIDVLLIHQRYGFIVFNVMSFGDILKELHMSQEDIDNKIISKLNGSIEQLKKAEAMLSHLVSDIAPGLRITKTIAFPNLTAGQVQQAISHDSQLIEDLHRCRGTDDTTDLFLCSDELSDPETQCDANINKQEKLKMWWERRVTVAGSDSHMTSDVYKKLVARFCGPATTVSVPCTCPPRVSVKTLGQAVWWTGECYTAVITLFPEQVHLLHTAPPTLFVTGPPGTGKTVVLLLMAIQWLRCGHHVYVVSTWWGSRAACSMLYHLLLQTVKTLQSEGVSSGQPHLLMYELDNDKDVEKAVNDLSQAASGGSLYVIVDEVVPQLGLKYFRITCNKLLEQVPRLHLWAASCFHDHAPDEWQVEYLTRPLRSPPAVVREIEQDERISNDRIHPYSERGVSDHTDGPPVTRLYHRGEGHSGYRPVDCVTCGREVASFLHSLHTGGAEHGMLTSMTATTTTPSDCVKLSCLQWKDVLVLYWGELKDNTTVVSALREAGIPVRVMKDDDIEDVATARSDVVWMTDAHRVRGLERKVVVCLYDLNVSLRLHSLSRCSAQLVIVSPDR